MLFRGFSALLQSLLFHQQDDLRLDTMLEELQTNGEFTGDVPAPQSSALQDHQYVVDHIAALLNQAARGEEMAWAFSSAMASIMCPRRRKLPLAADEKDRLLRALLWAHATAAARLPVSYDRARLNAGVAALANIIAVWAEFTDERRNRQSAWLDNAQARILRNDLHNFSLIEEIAERVKARQEQAIASTLAGLREIAA
jgi:hypothetical protein